MDCCYSSQKGLRHPYSGLLSDLKKKEKRKKGTIDTPTAWWISRALCYLIKAYSSSAPEATQIFDSCCSTTAHHCPFTCRDYVGPACSVEWFHSRAGAVEAGDSDLLWETNGTCPRGRVERHLLPGFLPQPCCVPQPELSKLSRPAHSMPQCDTGSGALMTKEKTWPWDTKLT